MPFSIRPYRRLPLTYISGFMSLTTLLVLSSGFAYGEWVTVSEYKEEGKTPYVNPDAIRNGNLVKMWTLLDYKTTQKRDTVLEELEQEARAAKKGLWADPRPVPPWEWRRSSPENTGF
jgi:hypothetical protein